MAHREQNAAFMSTFKHARTGALAVAIACTAAVASCASSVHSDNMHQIKTLYQTPHCGLASPTLEVLDSPDNWDALLSQLHRAAPLGPPPNITSPGVGEFAVLVAWGQKPNGAYALALNADHATVTDGALVLPVDFIEPAPGSFASQVLVSPCLVLSVPDTADYTVIRAGDLSTTR